MKQNATPIHETKKEHVNILRQNKVTLENDLSNMNTSKNPDLTSVIYPTATEVVKWRMSADNRREK